MSGGRSGEIPHPHEVVTFKGLFFRRVGFTNWRLVLDRRLFPAWQWVAVFIDVFNRHAPTFNTWLVVRHWIWIRRWGRGWIWNWRWLVFGVNIDYVLNAFNYLSGGRSGEIPHPHEVVAVKGLFCCRVSRPEFAVLHDIRRRRQDRPVFGNVSHID